MKERRAATVEARRQVGGWRQPRRRFGKVLSTEEGRAQIADYASPAKVEDWAGPWWGQPSLGVSTEAAHGKAQGQAQVEPGDP
jgi:hypothetical protein